MSNEVTGEKWPKKYEGQLSFETSALLGDQLAGRAALHLRHLRSARMFSKRQN